MQWDYAVKVKPGEGKKKDIDGILSFTPIPPELILHFTAFCRKVYHQIF
jgi:hypothetical protein